jgi:hypothetical protein
MAATPRSAHTPCTTRIFFQQRRHANDSIRFGHHTTSREMRRHAIDLKEGMNLRP